MELEELKSIWKSNEPTFQPKDDKEIATMLKGRSVSIIDKMKRNVWFELIFTILVSVGLLIYAFTLPSGALKWTSTSFILMCLGYTIFYVKKIMLLNRFNPAKENMRANLVTLIDNLSSYLKFYRRSYTIFYPVYFCVGLLFGAIEQGTEAFLENIIRPKTIILLTAFTALLFFLSTKFTNWYLKKLYGNHLEKLKTLLNDIHG